MNDTLTQADGYVFEVQQNAQEIAPLSLEQLALIAGGECVVTRCELPQDLTATSGYNDLPLKEESRRLAQRHGFRTATTGD